MFDRFDSSLLKDAAAAVALVLFTALVFTLSSAV